MVELAAIEGRYAQACSARAAWFAAAGNALAALGLSGLARGARVVACVNDVDQACANALCASDVRWIDRPCVDDFLRASTGPDAGTPLVWFANSIGCRGLRVADLRLLAAAAREQHALLVVDNTVASLYGCHAISLGAHVVLESLDRVAAGALKTKVVAVSVARDQFKQGRKRMDDALAREAYLHLEQRMGQLDQRASLLENAQVLEAVAGGLDTIEARMQRHMDNARAIAEYLAAHPAIPHTDYPGLSCHVDREVASNVLMHGAGPAIDFVLPRGMTAGEFIRALDGAYRSEPAGGIHTRVSALDGDCGLAIRLFAGTDDPLAVVDDIDRALRDANQG